MRKRVTRVAPLDVAPGNGAECRQGLVMLDSAKGTDTPIRAAEHEDEAVRFDHRLLLFWLLRVACGLEFIGHGAFGAITKAAWVPYFGVVGIPERWAYRLMPVVGSADIFLGLLVLLKPVRIV